MRKAEVRIENHTACREAYGEDEYGNIRLQNETVCAAVSFLKMLLTHTIKVRNTANVGLKLALEEEIKLYELP